MTRARAVKLTRYEKFVCVMERKGVRPPRFSFLSFIFRAGEIHSRRFFNRMIIIDPVCIARIDIAFTRIARAETNMSIFGAFIWKVKGTRSYGRNCRRRTRMRRARARTLHTEDTNVIRRIAGLITGSDYISRRDIIN